MEKSWFFNNGEQYGQDELRKYFTHIYRDGVSIDETGTMELEVTTEGSTVIVGTGFAIIGGFAYENSDSLRFAVLPDANHTRIDRIVLRLDIATMQIRAAVKNGIPSSSPKAPQLQRDAVIHEISLAQISVTAGGSITVMDERSNPELCGAIRPRNLTELENMLQTFQKQFESWFNSQQAKGWRNIYVQEVIPEGAVIGSLWL